MGANDLSVLLGELNVLEALHRLPDSVALTTDEAAAFLRLSPTTLERLRRSGDGPVYMQGGAKGARGINQRVTYLKGDLIDYQGRTKVVSSLQAAQRRGQLFDLGRPQEIDLLLDVWTPQPFYIYVSQVVGGVHRTAMPLVIDRLGRMRIEWVNPIQVCTYPWHDKGAQAAHVTQVQQNISDLSSQLDLLQGLE